MSSTASCPEAVRSGAARETNAALSRHNLDFLRFVERNPECLERQSFAGLSAASELAPYPLQPWPTFVRSGLAEEAGAMTSRLCELVKSLPQRIFGNAPARLAEYYRLDPRYAALLSTLLNRQDALNGLTARGDFVHTARGFECLELNVMGNLGGWKADVWAGMYHRVPLFERFLRERGISYRHRSPLRLFFAHVLRRARNAGRIDETLRIAFVIPPGLRGGPESRGYAQSELEATLAEVAPDVQGEILICTNTELTAGSGGLTWHGLPIHAVAEQTFERVGAQAVRALLAGAVDVYNGPLSDLLSDKRNLALLSEHQEGGLFDEEERAVIATHVPWTREVADRMTTTWEGERAPLPAVLSAFQERLVLKPANLSKGEGVTLGRRISREAWEAAVHAALTSPEPWVVQAHLESRPYLYQNGERGCSEHDVIWGFFVFGQGYGGGFLRMMPKEGSSGIVNAAQGATEGVLMEVGE